MTKNPNSKQYDLEERTLNFAITVRDYIKKLPKALTNIEYAKQLIRASGSVGANYIEANDSLGKKDFLMKIRTSRREAKESRYWLKLAEPKREHINEKDALINEATELISILGAILKNSQ